MATYSVNWSAVLSPLAGPVSVKDVLVRSAAGYLIATTANRGTKRCTGIAASAGDPASGLPTVVMIEAGVIDSSISGLPTGTQEWVRVSSTGRLERCTPGVGDDIVGKAEADGSVHLHFGVFDSTNTSGGGGGGATLPIVLTTDVSGILPEANGGTGSAALPAGGLAGLTAMAAGDAASVATAAADATTKANAAQAAAIAASQPLDADLTAISVGGLAAGMATWFATPSSLNLLTAMTDKTGTGLSVFAISPTFRTSVLINNPANTFAYTLTPGAIAANRILNIPVLTATDTLAVLALGQTFTTKTMVLASNTITDTSAATGDLAKHNGTRFVRFARGTSLQVLRTNVGATDLEWATVSTFTPPTGTGVVTVTAGVLDAASTGTTGSGNYVRATAPTLSNPVITSASINNATSAITIDDCTLSGTSGTLRRLRFTDAIGPTVTGFDATGVADGTILRVTAVGGTVAFKSLDAGSAAANQISCGGFDINLPSGSHCDFEYDSTSSLWRAGAGTGI